MDNKTAICNTPIILADQQYLITESVKYYLLQNGYQVVETVQNYSDLLKSVKKFQDALIIFDYQNVNGGNLNLFIKLFKTNRKLKHLILTQQVARPDLILLRRNNMQQIALKTIHEADFLKAINSAISNSSYYSPGIVNIMVNSLKIEDSHQMQLTPTEISIVQNIAAGMTTKKIANCRKISPHTVNTHRKNIFRKLKINNSSELITTAIKMGWINQIEYYI